MRGESKEDEGTFKYVCWAELGRAFHTGVYSGNVLVPEPCILEHAGIQTATLNREKSPEQLILSGLDLEIRKLRAPFDVRNLNEDTDG